MYSSFCRRQEKERNIKGKRVVRKEKYFSYCMRNRENEVVGVIEHKGMIIVVMVTTEAALPSVGEFCCQVLIPPHYIIFLVRFNMEKRLRRRERQPEETRCTPFNAIPRALLYQMRITTF